jgi:elongation factor Ts
MVGSYVQPDSTNGSLVEVNCETDFVAKTDDFKAFVHELAVHITKHAPQSVSAEEEGAKAPYLVDQAFKDQQTVGEYVTQMVAKTGEKVSVRRFAHYQTDENGFVQDYNHMNGKIGVLIELALSRSDLKTNADLLTLAKDLAMQVAAAKPEYINRQDVPASVIEAEKKIYTAQAMNEGKPQAIAEKITLGRINKLYKEICLEEQIFIKDNQQTVAALVAEIGKKLGAEIKIVRFARFEKGEGIEKRSDDFAAEVMSQIKA